MATRARLEPQPVRSVQRKGRPYQTVYDLKTSTGNFIADGVLIHNCPWFPIDHDPLPEPVRQAVATAWQPIAYSRFGHKQLVDAGLDPAYVPHGVETDVYKPADKAEARRKFGIAEDGFLAVMVAANKGWPSRKSFGEVLAAWKKFANGHEDAVLYMHTHFGGEMSGGDLKVLIDKLGIPGQQIAFADPFRNTVGLGYDDQYMVDLYNAADVLVNPSMGEGFGLPILEAQACGTPVIVGSWTCYDQQTRVVTPSGLRAYSDVRVGDSVLAMEGEQIVETKVLETVDYPFDGQMIAFANKGVDMCVTPNHRVYHKKRGKKDIASFDIVNASDFVRPSSSWFYLPVAGDWPETVPGDESISVPDLELHTNAKRLPRELPTAVLMRLLGWYIAEGCLSKDKAIRYNMTRFSNTHPAYIEEICADLRAIGLSPQIYDDTFKGVRVYSMELAALFAECGIGAKNKSIPYRYLQMGRGVLQELFLAMMKGDGSRNGFDGEFTRYTTSSDRLKDDFVHMCLKLGLSPKAVGLTGVSPSTGIECPRWMIYVRNRDLAYIEHRQVSRQCYSGQVWCIRTETGNLFVERNGQYICSGNSMPELCFAGWKVRGQPFWNPGMASWQYVPFITSILAALEKAYAARGRPKLREKARKGALHYDADLVTEKYWGPVLEGIEAEIAEGGQLEAVSLEDAWEAPSGEEPSGSPEAEEDSPDMDDVWGGRDA